MTNAEVERCARDYAAAKAEEAAAKARAKPLAEALLQALGNRSELKVGPVTIVRRTRPTTLRSVPAAMKALARRKPLLHQVLTISATEWRKAVKAGEISPEIDAAVYEGITESAPWVEVTVADPA